MAYNVPTRRIAPGAGPQGLNLQILPLHERADFRASDMRPDDLVFVLVDLWTTFNGSWDVGAQPAPYGVVQWARQDYLFPPSHPRYNPDGGGDHHLFGMTFDPLGNPYPEAGVVFAPNGAIHLQPPVDPGQVILRTPSGAHGFANIPIWNNIPTGVRSADMEPEPLPEPTPEELAIYAELSQRTAENIEAQSIPGWSWAKFGMADIVQGGGLPNNWHVSTFAVWRAMTWRDYSGGPTPPPTPGPGPTPPTPGPIPVEPTEPGFAAKFKLALALIYAERTFETGAEHADYVNALHDGMAGE